VRILVASGPGVLVGSELKATGVGAVVLRAEQEGDETFAAAPAASELLRCGRGVQTVTFQARSPTALSTIPRSNSSPRPARGSL
jgi:hypothetical protein